MNGELHEANGFGAGRCPECRQEVLTYPEWDPEDGGEFRLCVHCDETIPGEIRWLDGEDLGELGYTVEDPDEAGSGCATCGTGGCAVSGLTNR